MGLELVDITFRLEQKLDISLSEEDFQRLFASGDATVGQLYDLLLEKKHLRDQGRYDIGLHYDLWELTRDVLHRATHRSVSEIELSTDLEFLFPRQHRRELWSHYRALSPYEVHDLDYPPWVPFTGWCLALAVVVMEQFPLWQLAIPRWAYPVLVLTGIVMVGETHLKLLAICSPLRVCFPRGIRTVKELCRSLISHNYHDICEDLDIQTDEQCRQVWNALRDVLVDSLGVDPGDVRFDSRIIKDLGMN